MRRAVALTDSKTDGSQPDVSWVDDISREMEQISSDSPGGGELSGFKRAEGILQDFI